MDQRFSLALAVASFCTLAAVPGLAATYDFEPDTVHEHLEDDIFDDDLDVDGERNFNNGLILQEGDIGRWDYRYRRPYRVLSGDDVDLTVKLSYSITTTVTIDNVVFYLTNDGKEVGGTRIEVAGSFSFGPLSSQINVIDENDILGKLQGKRFNDFHLQFRVRRNTFTWMDAGVYIEAGDIEPVPLPPAAISLATPFAFLWGRRRRARRLSA